MGPLRLPYCPLEPTAKQEFFLRRTELEVFTGGSAGGGKTIALLAAAVQYCDIGGYSALLLRPTLTEFFIPGGMHELAQDWLGGHASWVGGPLPQWRFPSGATLTYGYLSSSADIDRYKGGELHFIGFDELVGYGLREYLGMLRMLRTSDERLAQVPMRMRAASNPSTSPRTMPNQAWIKQRFIDPATRAKGALFIPSSLADNPHLDRDEYISRLEHMLPADRERLIHGNWDIMEEGALFRRDWFRVVPPSHVEPPQSTVRYWDLAATEPGPSNPDPDWTVGLRLERDRAGTYTVRHIVRGRWPAHQVEAIVKQTAQSDGRNVPVYLEQEPGASGKAAVEYYQRQVLAGYSCHAKRSTGDKLVRATPVAAAAGNGFVQIVEGCPHLLEFLDETSAFGEGVRHDDIVDALSGAHHALTDRPPARMRTFSPNRQGRRILTQHDRFGPYYGI